MGASGWKYIAEYEEDLTAALRRLHLTVFEARDYYWPARGDDEPVWPTTFNELAENLTEEGTHSILDIRWVTESDGDDRFAHSRALTDAELQRHFGTTRPTLEQFESAYSDYGNGGLAAAAPRWSGLSATLYHDGVPDKIAFWGFSGD
jgi:hypothetical protein